MTLRYLFALFRTPNRVNRHFLHMGRGIERRATKMAAYWDPHLQCSKQAQQRWASASTGREVAILGAGRLMDVDLEALGKSFQTLWLIDADPISVTQRLATAGCVLETKEICLHCANHLTCLNDIYY